jgi:hypothetical protein
VLAWSLKIYVDLNSWQRNEKVGGAEMG